MEAKERVLLYPSQTGNGVYIMQHNNELWAMCSECCNHIEGTDREDGVVYWACRRCLRIYSGLPKTLHVNPEKNIIDTKESLDAWVKAWTGLEVEVTVKT